MLVILGSNLTMLSKHGDWPAYIKAHFGECDYFFTNRGHLLARSLRGGMVAWSAPIVLDDFWLRKISESLSFQCAKHLYALGKKTAIKDISHLICKFYNFKYIPSNKIITGS